MAEFQKFHYASLDDLRADIERLNVNIPISEDTSILQKEVKVGGKTAPNAFAILPMEGCDSEENGAPSELTRHRYRRFAEGGAGLLWFEACAVMTEGKANPLQLCLTEETFGGIQKLVNDVDTDMNNRCGYKPVKILQLTHSGRYSRPGESICPVILYHDPLLDPRVGIKPEAPVLSDEALDALVEKYVKAAVLAQEAGFDGVDIKSCHRYLLSELLASHTRTGKYGGSFENRSSLLLQIIKEVRKATGNDFIVACRFSVYDAHPYPYGFGVAKETDSLESCLDEPLELVRKMKEAGINLLSSSVGNVYYRFPFLTRPMDTNTIGGEEPNEHPLEGIERLLGFTREIQKAAGEIPVIGNGYSWLRQYIPNVGAGVLAGGEASMIGIGRQAFAYPSLPCDLFEKGALDPKKACITCSKCTQIMRDGGTTGCPVRDGELYLPIYRKYRALAEEKQRQA